MIPQQKRLADGRQLAWTVELDSVQRAIPWAREQPQRLEQELRELAEHFPTWVVTFGRLLEGGWPHAERIPCPACGELLVPADGVRCVACRQSAPPARLLLGFTGRLPVLATGRRCLAGATQRAREARDQGRPELAQAIESFFLPIGAHLFYAPPVWVFCPSSFPHGEPMVMVRPDHFQVLGIPEEHVYPGTRWRLCNYASWTQVSVRTVVQQRIIPRLYLDLMIADLAQAGRLSQVLAEMDLTLHALYNAAGRSGSLARFEALWSAWSAS